MGSRAQLTGMLEGNPVFSFSVIKELLKKLGWQSSKSYKGGWFRIQKILGKLGWEGEECYFECTVWKPEGCFCNKEKQIHLQLSEIDQEIPEEIQKITKARFKALFDIESKKVEKIIEEVINWEFIQNFREQGCRKGYLYLEIRGQFSYRFHVRWDANTIGISCNIEKF